MVLYWKGSLIESPSTTPFLAIFDDDFEMQEHRIRPGFLSRQSSMRLELHVEMLSVFFVVLFRRAARLGGQLEILLNHPHAAVAVVAVPAPETQNEIIFI